MTTMTIAHRHAEIAAGLPTLERVGAARIQKTITIATTPPTEPAHQTGNQIENETFLLAMLAHATKSDEAGALPQLVDNITTTMNPVFTEFTDPRGTYYVSGDYTFWICETVDLNHDLEIAFFKNVPFAVIEGKRVMFLDFNQLPDFVFHRTDGPSSINLDGTMVWMQNNHVHRLDGPALLLPRTIHTIFGGQNQTPPVTYWLNGKVSTLVEVGNIATSEATPQEIIIELALSHPDPVIAGLASHNPNCPEETRTQHNLQY